MSTDEQNWLPAGSDAGTDFDADFDLTGLDTLTAARDVPPPSATVLACAQAVILAAVQREEPAEPVPAPARPRRTRRWIVAGVAVAAVATAAAVLPVVDFDGSSAANASAATTFLNKTADHAGAQADHRGRYWKVQLLSPDSRDPLGYTSWETRDGGYASDGHGHLRHWSKPEASRVGPDGKQVPLTRQTYWGGPSTAAVTWDQVAGLPTDPEALRERLDPHDPRLPGAVYETASDLLASAPVTSRQRAALYQVIASLPGVHLDGTAKDELGRTGTAVSMTQRFVAKGPVVTWTLLIDPDTGKVLQRSDDGRKGPLNPATYVFTGWTDKIA
ncbi:CU044_5270 family protein [Streptomyces sp. CA-111067]|uniref:CU044_5270 family protein n=1 Tax=Streptomyces sp. CA-111067 TaxID=3240046 RepID=UPI003D962E48